MTGTGFQGFVAWRYLMARPRRVSRLLLGIFAFFAVLAAACGVAVALIKGPDPRSLVPVTGVNYHFYALVGALATGGVALLVLTLGVLRYYFTFFTTVPMAGVWIGAMALVVVLSVMNGFENDLQEKILGSNAHIQVIKGSPEHEGDGTDPFLDWKKVKAKIDQVPGVVASMPFASSEAVIVANNNYGTVIIKGVDPNQVGKVTKLGEDVDDPGALRRLRPLVPDEVAMPKVAPPHHRAGAVDPAPADMPGGAEPVDYSGGASGVVDPAPEDFGAPPQADDQAPADYSEPAPTPPDDYGGDARAIVGDAGVPTGGHGVAHVITVPMDGGGGNEGPADIILDDEGPRGSGRTQSLPGILVGRELVKTIHMYTGEEVRVVSPLSDPSNPDATGTPIPYNRDFRVAGVFYTGMYEYDLKNVYVPLDALQEFLDLGDAVDGIEVRINDPNDTDTVGDAIRAALGPGYTVRDWKDLNRNLFSALKLEKIAMFLILAIVILVASFSIIGNLIMVVVEKAKEIALLKTLGAGDLGIMILFVVQGLFIGVIGTALGVVYGLGICWAGESFDVPLNPDVYYIDRVPVHVDYSAVAAIFAAGILISVAATIYPAFVAARLRPAQGLRHD